MLQVFVVLCWELGVGVSWELAGGYMANYAFCSALVWSLFGVSWAVAGRSLGVSWGVSWA